MSNPKDNGPVIDMNDTTEKNTENKSSKEIAGDKPNKQDESQEVVSSHSKKVGKKVSYGESQLAYMKKKESCPIYNHGMIKSDVKAPPPKIEVKPGPFLPMPYTFRVPAEGVSNITCVTARCPPLYIQLDHTLAVIWSLFSPKELEIPLGINQLHWAYAFLRTILNDKGRRPKDVAFCLEQISKALLGLYASLLSNMDSDLLLARDKNTMIDTDESKSNVADSREDKEEKKDKRPDKVLEETEVGGEPSIKSSSEKNKTYKAEILATKNIPFSLNYAEMICRNPTNKGEEMNVSQVHSSGLPKDEKALVNENQELANKLKKLHKDQMHKLIAELEALNDIDSYYRQVASPKIDEISGFLTSTEKEITKMLQKTYNEKA